MKKVYIRFVFFILLFNTLGVADAGEESILLGPKEALDGLEIETDAFRVHLDVYRILTLETLFEKQPFIRWTPYSELFSQTEYDHLINLWGVMTFTNQSEQNQWVINCNITDPNSRYLFYSMKDDSNIPLEDLSGNQSAYIFPISRGETVTLLFCYTGNTITTDSSAFSIATLKNYQVERRSDFLFFGIFVGVIVIMVFYNLFLLYTFKDVSYLYFIGVIIFIGLFQVIQYRLPPFFFPSPVVSNVLFRLFQSFSVAIFLAFSWQFLNIKDSFPALFKVYKGFLIVILGLTFLGLIINSYNIVISYLTIISWFIAFLVVGYSCVRAIMEGNKPAIYFSLAIGAAVLAGLLYFLGSMHVWNLTLVTLVKFRVLDNATLLMIFLFSLALAYRINLIKAEKDKAQQQAIDNLNKADKLKDQFLANTSHELRTPLAGIIGLADSVMDSPPDIVPDMVKDVMKEIISSGKRLSNLINDLLDFSKLKKKNIKIHKASISMKQVTDMVFSIMAPLARDKNLKLINGIEESLPPVLGDENRLQQVLMNLIGNGIKFTHKGEIVVSARCIGTHVYVSVTDTGIGIPEDKFDDIFNSFEQVDGSASRSYDGTGIGLTISRQLVELHDGKLWVERSELDKGSTFTFLIPQADEKPEDLENTLPLSLIADEKDMEVSVPSQGVEDKGIFIIVVDDEPSIRKVVNNMLMAEGYRLRLFSRAGDVLEYVTNYGPPDLILMDIMMPGMTGFELCREIRKQWDPISLPIIILTARSRVTDFVNSVAAGANDYLAKPFTKRELVCRMENQLRLRELSFAGKKGNREFEQWSLLLKLMDKALQGRDRVFPMFPEALGKVLPHHFLYHREGRSGEGDFLWYEPKEAGGILTLIHWPGEEYSGKMLSLFSLALISQMDSEWKARDAGAFVRKLQRTMTNFIFRNGSGEPPREEVSIGVLFLFPGQIIYSGIGTPLYLCRDKELHIWHHPVREEAEPTLLEIAPGDRYYLLSRGVELQLNEAHLNKGGVSRLQNMLTEIHQRPLREQEMVVGSILDTAIHPGAPVEDLTFLGFAFDRE